MTQRSLLRRQHGSGLAEFGLAASILLLLGLGSVELAHWMVVRQAVSLALMQAARAGTTAHASPERIAAGFEHALLPLFSPADTAVGRQRRHFGRLSADLLGPPWHIAVLSPHRAAWLDFLPPSPAILAEPSVFVARRPAPLAHAAAPPRPGQANSVALTHLPHLDNDYLALQHQHHLQRGWHQGRGPRSGQTIFEANTLTLALTYPHRPLLPTTRALLRLLPADAASYDGRIKRAGYLPLSRRISLIMQSHPARWPDLRSGKVTLGPAPTGQVGHPPGHCPNCHSDPPYPGRDTSDDTAAPGFPSPTLPWQADMPGKPGVPVGNAPIDRASGPSDTPLAPIDSALCGIALCCTG